MDIEHSERQNGYVFVLQPSDKEYTRKNIEWNRLAFISALRNGDRIDCWGRLCTPYARMLGLTDKQAVMLYDKSLYSYKDAADWLLQLRVD